MGLTSKFGFGAGGSLAVFGVFALLATGLHEATAEPVDPVIFTFATTGDCRYNPKSPDLTTQDKVWMENIHPLARILREVQAQKPDALFFTGDMIMGQTTNGLVLDREYAYWRGMIAGLLETGTYVVPVAGNHEVQVKGGGDDAETGSKAHTECEIAWRRNVGDLILDTNLWIKLLGAPPEAWDPSHTPPVGGPDPIQSDQRQLSFSFDFKGSHFAMINTDPAGNDSHAPNIWLREDLSQARTRGNKRFFVFGHKMAFTYHVKPKGKDKGLDTFPESGEAFWKVIQDFDATYFCGHEHIYHAMQPRNSGNHHPWQIIVGAAGAPFEAKPGDSANPNDRKFGWTLIKISASGHVRMDTYLFDERFGPTTVVETIDLTPPGV